MSYAGLYEKNDPRIEKIVLVSAAGPCMKFDWSNNRWGLPGEFFEEAVKVFENKQIDDLFEVFHTFHRIRFKEIRGDDVEWIKGMLESASKDALVGATIAMQNCDLRQYLPEIHVSTKICHGLLDEFVHYPLAEQQQHLIPSSNIVCFEFSDHLLFLDQAKRLADELSWNMQT
jgi:pimeloyl-ACP methyl ester carboxylesterase